MLVTSKARLKYVSIPPKKMRLVANMINGMPVEKALNILNFTPRVAARHMAKTLKSAAANALSREGTDNLKPEDLKITSILVDSAPTQKRVQFQSMGRVFRIRKRFCHLTILIEGQMNVEAPKKVKGRGKTKEKVEDVVSEKAAAKTPRKKVAEKTTKKATAKKAATKEPVVESKTKSATAKKADKVETEE